MSTELDTRTDVTTGLSIIEGIDLDAEVQCEDWEHADWDGHPADLIVRFHCCNKAPTLALCWAGWESFAWGVLCTHAGITYPRSVAATVLERLR